uniref:Uncharacterized protein n=1 Tax=Brassica oleracea var. oleracea TaxID=109376 RepID=A0A0D2ZZL1_BRAOL
MAELMVWFLPWNFSKHIAFTFTFTFTSVIVSLGGVRHLPWWDTFMIGFASLSNIDCLVS